MRFIFCFRFPFHYKLSNNLIKTDALNFLHIFYISYYFWMVIRWIKKTEHLTHFSPVSHFYTPWKRPLKFWEGQRFSDVFRGYRNMTLDWIGLILYLHGLRVLLKLCLVFTNCSLVLLIKVLLIEKTHVYHSIQYLGRGAVGKESFNDFVNAFT